MSKQVDSKVVEMRFDNSQFERNVQTSMSTLDKLKERLQFKDAGKSLDGLGTAVKKVDMTPLGRGVEDVKVKFSALEVMAVTALANITNSVVNSAKQWVSSLTIAPIKEGFSEYEMTLNAIQTTMAGTGKTAKEVAAELKKLDEYADQTVYSTADMLNNLPKFTNAGVDLEVATKAMIGIANATAHAGGDASKASIAFYNLGQAIGTGYLTRMDYNSINNAGIATMEWKKQMVEAAIAQGTLTKSGEDAYVAGKKTYSLQQLFIDGLQEQWATTEVMTKVFSDYGDETTEIGKAAWESATKIKTFSMMMDSLKASVGTGWKDTWELVFGDLDGATEFWTGLYNAIGGVLDKMAEVRNNFLKKAFFGKSFEDLSEKIKGVLAPIDKVSDAVENASSALKDLGEIVDSVIIGNFGNGKERVDALTKAGYNFAEVQNKVNEKLGNSYRYAVDATESQEGLANAEQKTMDATKKLDDSTGKLLEDLVKMSDAELENLGYTKEQISAFRELETEADKLGMSISDFVDNIDTLNGRTILLNSFKNIGQGIAKTFEAMGEAWKNVFPPATADQLYNIIAGFHKLTTNFTMSEETAGKVQRAFEGLFSVLKIGLTLVGGPLSIAFKLFTTILSALDIPILDLLAWVGDCIVSFENWLDSVLNFQEIFDGLKASLENILSPFEEVKKAWEELFPKETTAETENAADKLGELKESFNISETAADNFKSICSGLEAVLKGLSWTISGSLTSGLKLLKAILGLNDMTISDLVAKIADYITMARKWIDEHVAIGNTIDEVAKILWALIEGITGVAKAFWELESVQKIVENIKEAWASLFGKMGDGIESVSISSFVDKIETGFKALEMFITKVGNGEIIGSDILKGLVNGITGGFDGVISAITSIVTTVIDTVKALFGIQSPSKVFMAIGAFLITGLITGLQSESGGVIGALKVIGTDIINFVKDTAMGVYNFLKNLNLGTVIAGLIAAGSVVLIKKVFDIVSTLTGAIKGFGDLAGELAKGMKTIREGLAPKESGFDKVAKNLLKIAIAIGIVAASIYLLSKVPIEELGPALVAFAVIVLGLGLLGKAASTWDASGADKACIQMAATLRKLAITAGLLALLVKVLGNMEPDKLNQGLGALAKIGVGMVAAILALAQINYYGGQVDQFGKVIIKIGVAVGLIAIATKILGGMHWDHIVKALKALGLVAAGIIVAIAALAAINKWLGPIQQIGVTMIAFAGAIAILALTAAFLGNCHWDHLVTGLKVIGLIAAGMIAAIIILAGVNKWLGSIQQIGVTMIAFAGAIAILAIVALIVGEGNWDHMVTGLKVIGLIAAGMVVMIGILAAINKKQGEIMQIGTSLLMIAGAIAILAVVAILLGLTNPDQMWRGVGAIAVLGVVVAGLIAVTKLAQKCVGLVVVLLLAITLLAGAVYLLSTLDPAGLENATSCMVKLIAYFGLLVIATSMAGTAIGPLIVMTVAIGLLAGALYLLATLPVESVLGSAIALSGLMLTMAALLAVCGTVGLLGPAAIIGVGSLLALMVVMTAFLLVLSALPDLSSAQGNIDMLTNLMNAFAKILLVIGPLAPLAVLAAVAIGLLVGVMTAVGVLVAAVGWLVENTNLEKYISSGIPLMIQLANGIGQMLGAFIAGFSTQVASMLPVIAQSLTDFMSGIQPFLALAQNVDASVLKGVAIIVAAIIALTAAELISAAGSFLSGGISFADLGMQLSAFGAAVMPFLTAMSTIDPAIMQGVQALATAILTLTASDIIQGISSFFGNDMDFAEFGNQLAQLGPGVAAFGNSVKDVKPDAIKAAAESVSILAEMAKDLPNSGGWLGAIVGDNDMGDFGVMLESFGKSLVAFSNAVSADGGINIEAINKAVEAGKALGEMNDSIPNIGGVTAWFAGDNKLDEFGKQIAAFGKGLKEFGTACADLILENVNNGVEAGKALAEMNGSIGNMGGVVSWFTGDNGLAEFGENIVLFGAALVAFSSMCATLNLDAFTVGVEAGKALTEIANSLPSDDADLPDLEDFGDDIVDFGEDLADFSNEVSGVNLEIVKNAVAAAKEIFGLFSLIPKADESMMTLADIGSDIKTFGKHLADYSDEVVDLELETITASVTAAKDILGLLSLIPKEDEGMMSLSLIGSEIATFGTHLSTYSSSVEDMEVETVMASIQAAAKIIGLFNSIPQADDVEGGLTFSFMGEEIAKFGEAISDFSEAVEDIDTEAVSAAVSATSQIVGIFSLLTTIKDIQNGVGLNTIGSELKTFGEGLDGMSKALEQVKFPYVYQGLYVAEMLISIVKQLPTIREQRGKITLEEIGKDAHMFALHLEQFYVRVDTMEMSTIYDAIGVIYALIQLIKSMNEINTEGVDDFVRALDELASADIEGISGFAELDMSSVGVNLIGSVTAGIQTATPNLIAAVMDAVSACATAFTFMAPLAQSSGMELGQNVATGIASTVTNITTSALTIVAGFISGIESQIGTAYNAGYGLAASANGGMKTAAEEAYEAGENAAAGFISGIEAMKGEVYNQGYELGLQANAGMEAALDINSPSKVFRGFGFSTVEGFVQGIDWDKYKAKDAAYKLGESINGSFCDALEIHSPSVVMNENGEYVVQGITEGIEGNESAEEAAEKKADNIVEAFSKEFDKIDLDVETIDLESQIAIKKMPDGHLRHEAETLAKKLEEERKKDAFHNMLYRCLQKELENETDPIAKALIEEKMQEEYNNALQTQLDILEMEEQLADKWIEIEEKEAKLQEDILDAEYDNWVAHNKNASESTKRLREAAYNDQKMAMAADKATKAKEAYEKSLNELGAESEKTKEAYVAWMEADTELAELSSDQELANKNIWLDRVNATKAYHQWLKDYKDGLLAAGMTMEEIQKAATQATGYDPTKPIDNVFPTKNSKTTPSSVISSYGEEVSASYSSGIQNGYAGVTQAAVGMSETCVSAVSNTVSDWITVGKEMANGFVEGIKEAMKAAAETVADESVQSPLSKILDLINGELEVSLMVRPVVDMSGLDINRLATNRISAQYSSSLADTNNKILSFEHMINANNQGHADMLTAIRDIRGDVANLGTAIANMQVTLDSKAIVGGIITQIDNKLGQIANHKGRGN